MDVKKIVIAGHDLKFAQGIINWLNNKDNVELKIDKWYNHNSHDEEFSKFCVEWADVIFCEWGLGNAVWYSLNKKKNQKLYIRMHRQEIVTNYPRDFTLGNVDKIIAVSPHIYEDFYKTFKFPRDKMQMIYNYVDMELFSSVTKSPNANYHLGMIGISPRMKRLDLGLEVFKKMWEKDPRYKLYIKGKMPQEYNWIWNKEEERTYYEKIFEDIENSEWGENVFFDGFGDDVAVWLSKIGFILSTSDFESFHLAVAEGMASGAYPIVRAWEGASTIYANDYLVSSADEAARKILNLNVVNIENMQMIREKVREEVKEKFSFDSIIGEYEKLLLQ